MLWKLLEAHHFVVALCLDFELSIFFLGKFEWSTMVMTFVFLLQTYFNFVICSWVLPVHLPAFFFPVLANETKAFISHWVRQITELWPKDTLHHQFINSNSILPANGVHESPRLTKITQKTFWVKCPKPIHSCWDIWEWMEININYREKVQNMGSWWH